MRKSLYLFLFTLIAFAAHSQEKPFPNSQFISVDSIQLHYRVWEAKTSPAKGNILLLHGFVSSTYTWRNNCEFLAEHGYRVVTPDLPAFGYSDRPEYFDHSPINLANLVFQFLAQVDANAKWHIAGHSSSGSIIAAMTLIKPEVISSATIVDGTIEEIASSDFYDAVSGFLEVAPVRVLMSFMASKFLFNEVVFTDFLHLASFKRPEPEVVKSYIKPFTSAKVRKEAFDLFRMKEQIDIDEFYEKLPEINLIWGKRDMWIPVSVAKRIQRRTGKGQLHIIKKAGHTPMETHPEEFNRALLEMIEGD